jgi:hypothetical protein
MSFRYSADIMEMLLHILRTASGEEYRLLRCRAFEASGIIAVAVGKAVGPDDELSPVPLRDHVLR